MIELFVGLTIVVGIGLFHGWREAKNKRRYLLMVGTLLPAVLLILLLLGPLLPLSPLKPGFTRLRPSEVTVFYPTSSEIVKTQRLTGPNGEALQLTHREMAEQAATMIQQAIRTNQNFYRIPVTTSLTLAKNDNDFFRIGGVLRGGGTGNEFTIVINEPYLNEKLIAHELSHKAIRNLLGPINSLKLPTWFDEGMATYLADQNDYVSPAELRDNLTPQSPYRQLSRWEGFLGHLRWKFTDIKDHRFTYGHMYLFLKYLFDTYGEERMYQLVLDLKTDSFAAAFQKTLGVSPDQAHEAFIAFLSQES